MSNAFSTNNLVPRLCLLPKCLSGSHGQLPSFLRKQESSFFSGFPPSRERRTPFV